MLPIANKCKKAPGASRNELTAGASFKHKVRPNPLILLIFSSVIICKKNKCPKVVYLT